MAVVIDGSVGTTSPIGNLNSQSLTTYTVPASTNLVSAGPVTVATGSTITVSTGSRWVIV